MIDCLASGYPGIASTTAAVVAIAFQILMAAAFADVFEDAAAAAWH